MNKYALKEAALATLKVGGGFHLRARSKWRRERLLILCYHGFTLADEHEWNRYMYMTGERFAERLETLKQGGYNVLPLGEAFTRLKEGSLPDRAVTITIDDGTYDFYRTAFPLLRRYNYPATVYLTTYYCVQNDPVFLSTLLYLLWKCGRQELEMKKWTGESGTMPLRDANEQLRAGKAILERTAREQMSSPAKTELLAAIADDLGLDFNSLKSLRQFHIMNPEEVREVSKAGIDVELHTHRHRTPVDRELFLREIRDNRGVISAITGKQATHFCYPCGDYNSAFLPWLKEEGVVSATTCRIDLAERSHNALLLPRFVDTMYQNRLRFESWCSGAARLLPRTEMYRYEEPSE